MKAKMIFFDKTNAGRIINRFSGDMETVDGLLPWSFDIFLEALARGSGFVIGLIILMKHKRVLKLSEHSRKMITSLMFI